MQNKGLIKGNTPYKDDAVLFSVLPLPEDVNQMERTSSETGTLIISHGVWSEPVLCDITGAYNDHLI